MAYAYHDNKELYFEHQYRVTADHVIPFVERSGPISAGARVLEIGCAEAGVLRAFLERGATGVGVDLSARRLALGREFLADAVRDGRLELLHQDAAALREQQRFRGAFDLIVLKDVIEHVEDRPELLALMRDILSPSGRVFMAFPPWAMPFGGHQQICRSRILSRTPYFHLLPMAPFRALLRAFQEPSGRIESLLATKRTGIGSHAFEELVERSGYRVIDRRLYLLNPMYGYRFGLPPLVQVPWVAKREALRDLITSCAYYTLSPQ